MRIVITGGAGFIGSHLCDRFIREGHQVVVIDNLITGSLANIQHLMDEPGLEFLEHDVSKHIALDGPVDVVMHFASPASPKSYTEFPIQTLKVGGLGTHNSLGLAKANGATFVLASTSEVYGDPEVHPQPESYRGSVSCTGPRAMYDEAKRYAEAMTMSYHRVHNIDTRIIRIFNSVLADETIVFFNDSDFHPITAEEYAKQIEDDPLVRLRHVEVPCFDPKTHRMVLKRASAFIKYPAGGRDAFLITTRYGRKLKVTGDHSVFRRGLDGLPEAVPVRYLTEDDYIALPAYLPVIEKDVQEINLGQILIQQATCDEKLWKFTLVSQQLDDYLVEHGHQIYEILMASPRFDGSQDKRNTVGCQFRKYCNKGLLPLYVISKLEIACGFTWPEDGYLRPYTGGGGALVPNKLKVDDDILWLLGFFLAEGTAYSGQGTYMISMCSDERFLERAARILTDRFKVRVGKVEAGPGRGPSIYVHSKALHTFFEKVFEVTGYSHELRVPPWVMQLPLSRLKFFLEGYRQGDGTHTDYLKQRELAFNTSSRELATDLIFLLMRFGIVGSLGEYETTFSERYGDRKFPFWRVTVCEVSDFNILNWDQGVEQTLNATRLGDLVWAKIRSIELIEATDYVYDFSVPGAENFVAGSGVIAHNTYGPRMQLDDGRVVPNFVGQALRGEPLTVYGDGSQTRSFCYVSDLVEGIVRLLDVPENEPINLGNPHEISILDFARKINDLTGNPAGIVYQPLPPDDPTRRCPDITKIRRLLAWEPTVGLDEGMAKTIAWFQEQLLRNGR